MARACPVATRDPQARRRRAGGGTRGSTASDVRQYGARPERGEECRVKQPIGYYVHHQGDGHRQRALALAEPNPQRITLLGTGLNGRTRDVSSLELPDDRNVASSAFDGVDGAPSRPQALHYAPLNHAGVRARMGLIAGWISDAEPALLVVDVSVEVAMLARLCSVPVAFVRLNGRRDDPAHLEAYRAASLLIAPFDARLDNNEVPDWVREKT